MGLSCYDIPEIRTVITKVSMPSWAWVVTMILILTMMNGMCVNALMGLSCYWLPHWYERYSRCVNALMGLSCYVDLLARSWVEITVSMPSWAWVVTARMSNILNFSWYFLCIPAIYKCILAYLPIFFNQLSKFLRCESPSTFLGTCLSHHSFIIFLVTNTNTLFSGLYLISTPDTAAEQIYLTKYVSMPSRAYTSFLRSISVAITTYDSVVSMPSRAYTSFLLRILFWNRVH